VQVSSDPPTPVIVREMSDAIGALPARGLPGTEDTKSVGVWSDDTPIAMAAHTGGEDDTLWSDKDIAESEFAGEPQLAALACCLDMRL
jgi:hypothetical protein